MDTLKAQRAFDAIAAGCWAAFTQHVEAELSSVHELVGVPETEMRDIVCEFFTKHPMFRDPLVRRAVTPLKRGQVMKWLLHDSGCPSSSGRHVMRLDTSQGDLCVAERRVRSPSTPPPEPPLHPDCPPSFQHIVHEAEYLVCVDWLEKKDVDAPPIWTDTPDATHLPQGTDIATVTIDGGVFDLFDTIPQLKAHAEVRRLRHALASFALQAVREVAEGDCAQQISTSIHSVLGTLCVQHVIH
eukprot:TRINITY_DN25502_c0_g1_i1.p3 TRINITY_DN25502_c0_g1~~TRINITY_DN25502_c0_g1_i1.p3  ORF type:complete len:242 (+),score=78.32 TRINITY_DN25502_c0_g1_i1:80-805(+)